MNNFGNPCHSQIEQRICSRWGAQDYELRLFFISTTERVRTLFSVVTELAEIAHEVIFYLSGLHFLE